MSPLLDHFRKYVQIDPKQEATILEYFKFRTFSKKELLLQVDKKCKLHFFVIKGCLRLFFLKENGSEQTIQFAIENWWLTDYLAYANQSSASFSIQAVETTQVLYIDRASQEQLCSDFPQLDHYFRRIYERAYSAMQLHTKYLYDFSREEFYHHFSQQFPEFIQRVPQHLVASYLNMTPEYLSEIKNKKRS